MLIELEVSNFALIEDLRLEFSGGLNILSGETGAGKSIVIGALNLILGERAAIEQIRQGCDKARVEGIISLDPHLAAAVGSILDEAGIESNDELILAREVFSSGRSVARVNGRAVPVSFLKELGRLLFDLHGQHQHQSLLRPEQHLGMLDAFSGDEVADLKKDLASLLEKQKKIKKELGELGEDSAERERKLDVYAFQHNEITAAAINPGEDDELARREKMLANAEKLCASAASIYSVLYGGDERDEAEPVIDQLNRARSALEEMAEVDPAMTALQELLDSAAAQVEEAAHELRDYGERVEYDPAELAAIQERVNLINSLKRKYGGTVEAVLEFAAKTGEEMDRLKNSEAIAVELEREMGQLDRDIRSLAVKLREKRSKAAAKLEKALEECLVELALPDAVFKVDIRENEHYTAEGMDSIEFLFSANRGEEARSLARIISGGEVSRVMLAMKTILADQDLVPTLIFDEIDSGIGGATIQAVAEKLAQLSAKHQVMCVTHSPQIAAMADRHYRLYKKTEADRTLTLASMLQERERREELARMLDGAAIDEVSLNHVDSLIGRAKQFKDRQN